jgi:hypothetical protein
MKKPEWKKELEEHQTVWNDETALRISNHLGHDTSNENGHIHRAIFVSTVSPTNTQGNDGDIWITYEA